MNNSLCGKPGNLSRWHRCGSLAGDKTRQGSARERTLKLAGYFFLAAQL
jgi:hypothetical protein